MSAPNTELTIDGETFTQWAERLFEFELCDECERDAIDHEPWVVMGHWFAHCKYPIDIDY